MQEEGCRSGVLRGADGEPTGQLAFPEEAIFRHDHRHGLSLETHLAGILVVGGAVEALEQAVVYDVMGHARRPGDDYIPCSRSDGTASMLNSLSWPLPKGTIHGYTPPRSLLPTFSLGLHATPRKGPSTDNFNHVARGNAVYNGRWDQEVALIGSGPRRRNDVMKEAPSLKTPPQKRSASLYLGERPGGYAGGRRGCAHGSSVRFPALGDSAERRGAQSVTSWLLGDGEDDNVLYTERSTESAGSEAYRHHGHTHQRGRYLSSRSRKSVIGSLAARIVSGGDIMDTPLALSSLLTQSQPQLGRPRAHPPHGQSRSRPGLPRWRRPPAPV